MLVLPDDGPGKEAAEAEGLRLEVVHMPVLWKAELTPRGILRFFTYLAPSFLSAPWGGFPIFPASGTSLPTVPSSGAGTTTSPAT